MNKFASFSLGANFQKCPVQSVGSSSLANLIFAVCLLGICYFHFEQLFVIRWNSCSNLERASELVGLLKLGSPRIGLISIPKSPRALARCRRSCCWRCRCQCRCWITFANFSGINLSLAFVEFGFICAKLGARLHQELEWDSGSAAVAAAASGAAGSL